MVHLIPSDRRFDEFNGSSGEKILYNKFSQLSDEWYIFHSIKWSRIRYNKMRNNEEFQQSESDFVIFNPNRGILTLEVKSGGYVLKNGRLHQVRGDNGKIVSDKSPMDQADSSKFAFRELISETFPNYDERYQVNSMVWLTDVEVTDVKGGFPHNYHIGENTFLHSDIVDVEKALNQCFDYYRLSPELRNKAIVMKTINLIAPEFKAIPSMRSQFNDEDYFIDRMTHQQSYLIDYLEEQKTAAIQGGAGTGKTILAVEKARRLGEHEKVVYLCFNSMLVEFLKLKYGLELPNVEFTSLYKLAAKALRQSNIDENAVNNFVNHLEDYPNVWDFESVIIDEGQDFANEQIVAVKDFQFINNEQGSFYVFYDRNQLVQQRNELEWLDQMDCRLILSINCRNPHSVAITSVSPIGIKEVKTKLPFVGEKPEMHITNDIEDATSWISDKIREITDKEIEKHQITILSVKGDGNSIFSGMSKIGNYSIASTKQKGKILFTTARKFKGLESDVVILVDVDAETFKDEEQKRLFYVGASRAKHRLAIVSVVDEIKEKAMIKAITNGKSTKRMRIDPALKITLR